MKVVRRHTNCFSRACHEVVRICRLASQSNAKLLNSRSEYNQRVSVPRLVLSQTLSAEDNKNDGGQGVSSNVGKVGENRVGNVSQDGDSAGAKGAHVDRAQVGLQPSRKRRRLNDNNNIGGKDAAVMTSNNNNRLQSRQSGCSGNRKQYKPKRRHKQTDRQ